MSTDKSASFHHTATVNFFREAKYSADDVADGNIGELIDAGLKALSTHGLNPGCHHLALIRAGYHASHFDTAAWQTVRDHLELLKSNPSKIREVLDEAKSTHAGHES